ncbi:Tc toxin subunit A-related protein [Caballeronia sp. M23-90]
MDVDRLFDWADPGSGFWNCHAIAEAVRRALQARYVPTQWDAVIKPLNDGLRENRKQALIAYLLPQQPLVDWGVIDADSLFEFLLIDVQMGTCMETSRIKQGIASVQQFVTRCMMGLEAPNVPIAALDRGRWEWMKEESSWELNRRTFVYPEISLQESLRDDKSPFYVNLESALLQKDVDPDMIESALHTYLFELDTVANMAVVGLYVQSSGNGRPAVLHIFGQTRNTPDSLYYRTFSCPDDSFSTGDWSAWTPMQVQVTRYSTSPDSSSATLSGVYLAPVVWDGRLLVFFPEFTKKSVPDNATQSAKFDDMHGRTIGSARSSDYWEIKLAWSELRDGKWTQKQVSTDQVLHCILTTPGNPTQGPALSSTPPLGDGSGGSATSSVTDISKYLFLPSVLAESVAPPQDASVAIDVAYAAPAESASSGSAVASFARFVFTGNEVHTTKISGATLQTNTSDRWQFQYFNQSVSSSSVIQRLYPLQSDGSGKPVRFDLAPYVNLTSRGCILELGTAHGAMLFYPPAHGLVSASATEDLPGLYQSFHTATTVNPGVVDVSFGATGTASSPSYSELKGPYALYNWELGFHAPMALIDKMSSAQQFDAALNLFRLIFDPSSEATDPQRVWQFPPFKLINPQATLEAKLESLLPNTPDTDVQAWRDAPFEPHVVARARPTAYMKWTVLQYVQLLIDYGDSYFRLNTLESVPLAIQCYVWASHILGPRPQVIPKRGTILPETYCSLLDKWDAFSDAMVELELVFPFSNQTTQPVVSSNHVVGLPNIFGFATSLYFGIPPNARLTSLRALIDNRLNNIRHCRDINGVFRRLPLFDFSLDEDLLAQAQEEGLTVSTTLDDLLAPVPNYRFNYLLQKAYAFAGEVKAMGAAYVAAREKGDAEGLAALRAAHEATLLQLVLGVKQRQLDEANQALAALQQNRMAPVARLQHYLRLIGGDLSQVPTPDDDFAQIDDPIETPIADSGLVLSPYEQQEMSAAAAAAVVHADVGMLESMSSALSIIPELGTNVSPFGIGISLQFGGRELSAIVQSIARRQQVLADILSYDSANAGRKGGYLRQLQDRVLQANTAGLEIKSIDKQILTQNIRIDIATKEITSQKQQVADAQAIVDYLSNKYTNQQLYTWMDSALRALHYQVYLLAYDMACRAEAVFRFERAPAGAPFLANGYWDASHDGVLAGETLEMALRQMEAAYVANRPYDFEVTRPPVWLREIDPLALVELRATGTCEFSLQEFQFDRDSPGHYMRRIKTLGVDIPCVVGPGISLSGTLTLLQHRFRVNTQDGQNGYAEIPGDPRFTTLNVPIDAIAICSGQNEHGAFELTFNGERYLPFEGAGAISRWRLELPPDFRPFDYDTISDVGLRLQYTACDGGAHFKSLAMQHFGSYVAGVAEAFGSRDGLFAAFELARDFPEEWYRGTQPDSNGVRQFMIDSLAERLPHAWRYARGMPRPPANIVGTDAWFVYDSTVPLQPGTPVFAGSIVFQADSSILPGATTMTVEAANALSTTSDQWKFGFVFSGAPATASQRRAWLILRYVVS